MGVDSVTANNLWPHISDWHILYRHLLIHEVLYIYYLFTLDTYIQTCREFNTTNVSLLENICFVFIIFPASRPVRETGNLTICHLGLVLSCFYFVKFC